MWPQRGSTDRGTWPWVKLDSLRSSHLIRYEVVIEHEVGEGSSGGNRKGLPEELDGPTFRDFLGRNEGTVTSTLYDWSPNPKACFSASIFLQRGKKARSGSKGLAQAESATSIGHECYIFSPCDHLPVLRQRESVRKRWKAD